MTTISKVSLHGEHPHEWTCKDTIDLSHVAHLASGGWPERDVRQYLDEVLSIRSKCIDNLGIEVQADEIKKITDALMVLVSLCSWE